MKIYFSIFILFLNLLKFDTFYLYQELVDKNDFKTLLKKIENEEIRVN